MSQEIGVISLPMPFKLGAVNCYLIHTAAGFFLIDTGSANARAALERELDSAGCTLGKLKLVIITHGDFDHTGNCAFIRQKYGAQIGMHAEDVGMVEHGDMFWDRKGMNPLVGKISNLIFSMKKSDRFTPDLLFQDGYDLNPLGFDARILHVPGHSKGSIAVLTAAGDLFCGDLLTNMRKPELNTLVDEKTQIQASFERLKNMNIQTVYPGHGRSFSLSAVTES